MWPDQPCGGDSGPKTPPFKVSRKWVGLRRSTDCDRGSRCEGFDMRGRYQVESMENGDQVLRINGLVTWKDDVRKKSDSMGVIVAMDTNDGGSEWAA